MVKEPLWLSVARAFEGLKEVPGPSNNPMIMNWARDIKAPKWYDNDDKAWCAIFMNRVLMACQLPMADGGKKDPYDLLRAKSFEAWGQELKIPAFGCLMVFKRPQGHHVFIYLGERRDAYYGIGGNQSNSVNYTWITKARLTEHGTRWPLGIPVEGEGRVWLTDDGKPVSQNEV